MTDANEMTIAIEEPAGGWYQPEQEDEEPANDVLAKKDDERRGVQPGTTDGILGLPVGKGHGLGRAPVVVLTGPPPRRQKNDLPGRRRPVVAIPDTFVDPEQGLHPWLGPTDGEVFVADAWTPKGDDVPRPQVIGSVRSLGKAAGHGTFIAGLIRQVAPDAEVIMLRVMHADGTVLDDHLLQALDELKRRVLAGSFVDVICLALGFRKEDSRDTKLIDHLRRVLGELGSLGVRVVASAGNNPDSLRVYPAALATAGNRPRTGLISVGSYDPDGKTCSMYSPQHSWITNREIGTELVSTMPAFQGPGRAGSSDPALPPYDPDDYSRGFARWSGTSFAAGVAAGRIAQALVNPAVVDPALDRHQRAEAALAALTRPAAC